MPEAAEVQQPTQYDEPLSDELEAQIDAALEAAKHAQPEPRATYVEYIPAVRAICLCINTGQRLLIPVEELQHACDAPDEQVQKVEVIGLGYGIDFTALDVQFSVEGLLVGRRGNRKWMEQLEAKRAETLEAAA